MTVAVVCALVLVVAVVLLVRASAAGLSALAERHGGESAATLAQTGTLAVGGLVLLLAVLDVLQVSVRSLLVGGALTGVVLGIALQQVLGNLLENARKSSPASEPISVALASGADGAEVSVSDRGPGIAPEAQERIFDKFVRGRTDAVSGTGLGLYISRQIVEAHVVLREGIAGDEACIKRLQDHVKATIAPYKYPRSVKFVAALPKTQTGKIQRFRLREREQA